MQLSEDYTVKRLLQTVDWDRFTNCTAAIAEYLHFGKPFPNLRDVESFIRRPLLFFLKGLSLTHQIMDNRRKHIELCDLSVMK